MFEWFIAALFVLALLAEWGLLEWWERRNGKA